MDTAARGEWLGLDHVQLAAPAGCETAAREFFEGILGMREISKPPVLAARGGAWFACGSTQLHVGIDAQFSPAKKAHPGFRIATVRALDALFEKLRARGTRVAWAAADEVPGQKRFHADDPWGNRLEFVAATA